MHITYLELYNEVGYDLLDASRGYWGPGPQGYGGPQDASLPRVTILEDEQGALHLRNVAMHRVASEEEALQLVWVGVGVCFLCVCGHDVCIHGVCVYMVLAVCVCVWGVWTWCVYIVCVYMELAACACMHCHADT